MSSISKLGSLVLLLSALGAAPLAAQECGKAEAARPSVVEYEVNWKNPLHLDGIQADVLKISTGGGGRAVLTNIDVGRIEIRVGGGSRVEVGGQADEVIVRVSGGSRYEAFDLTSSKVTVKAGGGSRSYTLAGDSFNVNVSGSASVYYRGEPRHISKHISKHSTLKQVKPKVQRSEEELRRLESLQRTIDMRMTLAPQVARSSH